MTRIIALALLTACAFAAPAAAQSSGGAASLAVVQRGLSMTSMRPMRLKVEEPAAGLHMESISLADAPALIQIGGDPGRFYRIRLPRLLDTGETAIVEDLTIWSTNAGDISDTRVARMDHQGRDMLRVTGRLKVASDGRSMPIAALPLSIDYE